MSSEFVEIGPRIYAVELVEAYAWRFNGKSCHIDNTAQTIYVNAAVPEDERADLLSRAVRRVMRRCCPQWRMVPLVGNIS